MPFAILPVLQWLGAGLWAFASSRMGQIIIVAAAAWFWAGSRADEHWRAIIAAEKAAAEAVYRAEVARQEQAAREIAAAATERAEEDAALERELRAQIEAFNAQEPINVPASLPQQSAPNRSAVIDSRFADVVRQFDAAAGRPAKPPRAAR